MSPEFCLRWNNHRPNLVSVFKELLQHEVLVDVTLAAGGQFIHAHRLVLSACSLYFKVSSLYNSCYGRNIFTAHSASYIYCSLCFKVRPLYNSCFGFIIFTAHYSSRLLSIDTVKGQTHLPLLLKVFHCAQSFPIAPSTPKPFQLGLPGSFSILAIPRTDGK